MGVLLAYDVPHVQFPEDFIRFGADIDFLKPLKKGINVRFGGDPLWLPLVYERLPSFCFCCGLLGHFFRNCTLFDRDASVDTMKMNFDVSLRASLLKRPRGVIVQTVDCGVGDDANCHAQGRFSKTVMGEVDLLDGRGGCIS